MLKKPLLWVVVVLLVLGGFASYSRHALKAYQQPGLDHNKSATKASLATKQSRLDKKSLVLKAGPSENRAETDLIEKKSVTTDVSSAVNNKTSEGQPDTKNNKASEAAQPGTESDRALEAAQPGVENRNDKASERGQSGISPAEGVSSSVDSSHQASITGPTGEQLSSGSNQLTPATVSPSSSKLPQRAGGPVSAEKLHAPVEPVVVPEPPPQPKIEAGVVKQDSSQMSTSVKIDRAENKNQLSASDGQNKNQLLESDGENKNQPETPVHDSVNGAASDASSFKNEKLGEKLITPSQSKKLDDKLISPSKNIKPDNKSASSSQGLSSSGGDSQYTTRGQQKTSEAQAADSHDGSVATSDSDDDMGTPPPPPPPPSADQTP